MSDAEGDMRAVPRRTLQVGQSLTKRDMSSLGTLNHWPRQSRQNSAGAKSNEAFLLQILVMVDTVLRRAPDIGPFCYRRTTNIFVELGLMFCLVHHADTVCAPL